MPQPALQIQRQRLGRPVALRRIFFQALEANRLQVAVDLRVDEPRQRRFIVGDAPQRIDNRPVFFGEQGIAERIRAVEPLVIFGALLASCSGGAVPELDWLPDLLLVPTPVPSGK